MELGGGPEPTVFEYKRHASGRQKTKDSRPTCNVDQLFLLRSQEVVCRVILLHLGHAAWAAAGLRRQGGIVPRHHACVLCHVSQLLWRPGALSLLSGLSLNPKTRFRKLSQAAGSASGATLLRCRGSKESNPKG